MTFPLNKTKIVATIGPASDSPEVLRQLILAGMNVVRLNFSHGDFSGHAGTIARVRAAAEAGGRRVAVMADLPGPKMRIGHFVEEPVQLSPGETFTLTTEEILGTRQRVTVRFPQLPASVRPGDRLFLNDGYIELAVVRIEGPDVVCRVQVGGELRSRKGVNLPGIDLGISAFTEHDRKCLEFALQHGVDAVSQSFVDRAADIAAVRAAAAELGYRPMVIAKIERSGALKRIDEIMDAADGVMMITNRLPTRAEATDVANAILDGTDAVMLSGESAMGRHPVDAVAMLARIAAATESHRADFGTVCAGEVIADGEEIQAEELIAASVEATIRRITPATVIVPTHSGGTARSIARFRLPVWITAVSSQEKTCRDLMFSYGVFPVCEQDHPDRWIDWCRRWREERKLTGRYMVLTEGPSRKHPDRNNRMEIIDLKT